MKTDASPGWQDKLDERLSKSGLRFTTQRRMVYSVLMDERDHPTAEMVFLRAKKQNPDISMATVYNCLDALVKCGMVTQVNLHRTASRYCPNMQEHCHFYCSECGTVHDIRLESAAELVKMPVGFEAQHYDISIDGRCPECARKSGGRRV